MGTNPLIDARDLVAGLFPQARWAVLNGGMRPSADSGLDIMVVLHDMPSLDRQLAWELSVRKPFLHRIITTGATLAGEPHIWRERNSGVARLLADQRGVSTPARPSVFGRGARRSRGRWASHRRVWTVPKRWPRRR